MKKVRRNFLGILWYRQKQELSALERIEIGPGAHPDSFRIDTAGFFLGLKWPDHEADNFRNRFTSQNIVVCSKYCRKDKVQISTKSQTRRVFEVKNKWVCTSILPYACLHSTHSDIVSPVSPSTFTLLQYRHESHVFLRNVGTPVPNYCP